MALWHAVRAHNVSRSFAAISLSGLLLGLLVFAGPDAAAVDGPLVYGIHPFGNSTENSYANAYSNRGLRPFNASTGANAPGFVITNAGGPVTGAVQSGNGLAVDPTSGTVYAILKIAGQSSRVLATINLSNGQATTIAATGRQVAGITFADDGTLYAVSGTGDTGCAACLYTLNKVTGAPSATLATLTNTGDGQAIAYNSADDMIYHANGNSCVGCTEPAVFEKIDPANSFSVTDIGYTGDPIPSEVLGIGYDAGTGKFIVTDLDLRVWSVTPGGAATQLSSNNTNLRGLIVTDDAIPTNGAPSASGDTGTAVRDAGSVTPSVLANDTDPEDDVLSIQSVTDPPHGTTQVAQSRFVTYQPDPAYCNDGAPTDDFTYTINGGSTATVAMTVLCQHLNVYAFHNDNLQTLERTFGAVLHSDQMFVTGGRFDGKNANGFGMAVDPKSNKVYAVVEVDPDNSDHFRGLARLDPLTGSLTKVLRLGTQIESLAFSPNGTLYGVSDGSAVCPVCLYRIDKATGARTRLTGPGDLFDESNDEDPHAIAFNPNDGMIYHATDIQSKVFEKIDPSNAFSVTNIGFSGDLPSGGNGLAFDPTSGTFVLLDADGTLFDVTPSGVSTSFVFSNAERGLLVGTHRTLSLRYSKAERLFFGELSSFEDGCVDGRTVSVFRKKRGPDALLGQPITDGDGDFALDLSARPGTYYATAVAEVTPLADCMASRSRNLVIR